MRFWKGHALGNDYIVLDAPGGRAPDTAVVRALCDRHRGVGSDGVLVGDTAARPVRLRIFNPDGTEAEKSGNGLRIFGAWLYRQGRVAREPFDVALPGETVRMTVVDDGEAGDAAGSGGAGGAVILAVDMGTASFRARDIGYTDAEPDAEVMGVPIEVDGVTVPIHLVSMGNPHCVVLLDRLDAAEFRRLAPAVQATPAFSRGVNVQIARVAGPTTLDAMVWERGAGETAASGSSACAIAAAARRVGAIDPRAGAAGSAITVRMPGGELHVEIDDDWRATLTGPAVVLWEGVLPDATIEAWSRPRPDRPEAGGG